MEITELMLWVARLGVLALMYLLLLILILALRADARASSAAKSAERPSPEKPPDRPMPVPPDIAPTTVSALQFLSGTIPVTGKIYSLFGQLYIGRGSDCAISIPNRFVSAHHSRIYSQEGVWMVEDLGSTNGTLVNGQLALVPQPLAPGDQLMIGDTLFEVK